MSRRKNINLLNHLLDDLTGEEVDLFVLFIDMCGSTKYKEKCRLEGKPVEHWLFRQYYFLGQATSRISQYKGVNVKTIGDEVFSYFDAATKFSEILKCCVEIVREFEKSKRYRGEDKIDCKISIDFGITRDGDVLGHKIFDPVGTIVDRAARMNKEAKENNIIFSNDIYTLLDKSTVNGLKQKYTLTTESPNLPGLGTTNIWRLVI